MAPSVEASVLSKPGSIGVSRFPVPGIKDGAMLVRSLMCGICGTDKHGYKGESIQYAGTPREVSGPYPAIPGHEIVAKVVKLSSRNGEAPLDFYGSVLAEGDRIVVSPDILCGKCYWCRHTYGYTWCDNIRSYGHMDSSVAPHLFGGWSEMMYLYPESHVFKISDDVPDEIAVLAEPMAVTYAIDIARGQSALPNQGLLSGDTVVILGVGPLGICHLIKSRLTGAGKIVAVDRSEYRLEMSRDFGANHTLDVTITSLEERLKLVQEVTDGRGADMVIECTGVPAVFIEGIDLLRQGGTFVEVGHFVDSGDVKLNPHRHICAKNIRMIGQTNLAYTGLIPSIKLLMANRDKYNFQQLTTHRFHFSRAEEALKTAMGLESMKVVITSD